MHNGVGLPGKPRGQPSSLAHEVKSKDHPQQGERSRETDTKEDESTASTEGDRVRYRYRATSDDDWEKAPTPTSSILSGVV